MEPISGSPSSQRLKAEPSEELQFFDGQVSRLEGRQEELVALVRKKIFGYTASKEFLKEFDDSERALEYAHLFARNAITNQELREFTKEDEDSPNLALLVTHEDFDEIFEHLVAWRVTVHTDSSANDPSLTECPEEANQMRSLFYVYDRYLIGEGAFGFVRPGFQRSAVPNELGPRSRVFAVKSMASTMGAERIAQEVRVARLAAEKCPDHICKVVGGFRTVPRQESAERKTWIPGSVSTVMEYCAHENFRLLKDKFRSHQKTQFYLEGILKGLAALHATGAVHRDMKPGNVLFDWDARKVKVCDFGMAATSKGAVKASRAGTRGFRAPEQLMLVTLDDPKKLDSWAVGVIALSIITRRYPFFYSPDDLTALGEIAALRGTAQLKCLAWKLKKSLRFPLDHPKIPLRIILTALSPEDSFVFAEPNPNMPAKWALIDLVDKLLTLDPEKRPSAAEALKHSYFKMKFNDCEDRDDGKGESVATAPREEQGYRQVYGGNTNARQGNANGPL